MFEGGTVMIPIEIDVLDWFCQEHLVRQKIAVDFVEEDLMGRMPDELLNFGLQVASLPRSLALWCGPHQVQQTFAMLAHAQVHQINTVGSSKRHFS